MPGEVNCLITKGLLPYVQRTVGPDGVAALCRAAGRPREYLMADHNWISLELANELVRVAMELMGEPDEGRWARQFADDLMNWKPREERSYLGTYTMGIGDPRTLYERQVFTHGQTYRFVTLEVLEIGRRRARFRRTPIPGHRIPLWNCVFQHVMYERFPTNWGLRRGVVTESRCAAKGAPACELEVRWRNPSLGRRFWTSAAAGAAAGVLAPTLLGPAAPWPAHVATSALSVTTGVAVGSALRERQRRLHTQRMLDLQADEVIYSNSELEKKFRDLEQKIDQLSLLIELSEAVSATLDPEKVYDLALPRLVDRMRYEKSHLLLVDHARQVLRGHRTAGGSPEEAREFEGLELPLDPEVSAAARAAVSGMPIHIPDVESALEPVHLATVRAFHIRSFVAAPLRVRARVIGVLTVSSSTPGRFEGTDVELISAVANQVALAADRAESFQTIEELSRSLEDKVRVRTEQLRAANEELQAAYRDLQQTQMQLVQREKMASVGQLVAGVAHELNNPIGFVYSNIGTLEDFVGRLRRMLESYQAVPLPDAERARVDERRQELKVDYALRYLDAMTQGIREGAERARKIVRDLRVFARGGDDVWQPVDLHEDIESSLTLVNHLLKDRITVHRKFGDLPPVECVRSQVDQVFLNLLANAAQAIQGPGEITIETRCEDATAVVRVVDTGPGIPADIIDRIFDPFFTTKTVGEGTGLGLSISYELAKKHGGDLRAESPPGAGAVFTLRLPITRVIRG